MISGTRRFRFHRPLDLITAVAGLILTSPALLTAWFAAGRAAHGSGFFRQQRIGRDAHPFEIVKFRTMRAGTVGSTVTTAKDPRITSVGAFLRRSKIDEIPQLINVLRGEMSLIGPRPDVTGFADELQGADRRVLAIRPGITGPASLLFANEELLLAGVDDPEAFNVDVIYPLKTAINRSWIECGTLVDDIRLLLWTIRPPADGALEAMINRWDASLDTGLSGLKIGK